VSLQEATRKVLCISDILYYGYEIESINRGELFLIIQANNYVRRQKSGWRI